LLTFNELESAVRSYSRCFPAVFSRAKDSFLFDEQNKRYIDFLSGAGSLNYGHNNSGLKRAIVDYIEQDGITHSLDLATSAKRRFIERFQSHILAPRGLKYKFQFTGPTGTNGVEAALKLARKVTGRKNVVSFTGAYHGLSAGALAVTANSFYRSESFVNRTDVSFLPYDGYLGDTDTIPYIRKALTDPASGVDHPAAVILETVQAEGGINVASTKWLKSLQEICREREILMIVDDIQAGNGRTGNYFSFERAGLDPDMVILSKSISGFGLAMTLLLLKPELDVWSPGEHSGTFRGNNLAFVAGAEALRFWENGSFAMEVAAKGKRVDSRLRRIAELFPEKRPEVRGIGLLRGIDVRDPDLASAIRKTAFENGLIVELCGNVDSVVKILPPLTIENSVLDEGLEILESAASRCAGQRFATASAAR
jgi:diaminobutyrate-2-oxoglutarate transaminase